jgi:hypothetical protein
MALMGYTFEFNEKDFNNELKSVSLTREV